MWRRDLLIIVIISLVSRLIFFSFFNYTPWIYNDEPGYLLGARALLNGEVITQPLSHNFPIGYSTLLLPAVMLTKNPIWQYQIGLYINSAIASLVGIVVYLATRKNLKNKAFLAGVLVSFYPPLFVYSGALMSEVCYSLFLIIFWFYFIHKPVNKQRLVVLTLLLVILSIIRAPGIFVALAFYISVTTGILIKRNYRQILPTLTSLLMFIIFLLLDKWFLFWRAGHYNSGDYLSRLLILFNNPLPSLRLFMNNALVFVFMLMGLPFLVRFKLGFIKKNPEQFLFVFFLIIGNILLTTTHSARQYIILGNLEYGLAFRYLAPYTVMIYAWLIMEYFKTFPKLKPNYWLLAIYSFLLVIFFQNQGWKFANNVSVILLANRSPLKIIFFMIFTTFVFLLVHNAFSKNKYFLWIIAVFWLGLSSVLIFPALNGPRFSRNVYEKEIDFKTLTSPKKDINIFLNKYLQE